MVKKTISIIVASIVLTTHAVAIDKDVLLGLGALVVGAVVKDINKKKNAKKRRVKRKRTKVRRKHLKKRTKKHTKSTIKRKQKKPFVKKTSNLSKLKDKKPEPVKLIDAEAARKAKSAKDEAAGFSFKPAAKPLVEKEVIKEKGKPVKKDDFW